jgi:hypothetical protein
MMKSKGQQSGRVTIRGLAFIFACTALPWLLLASPVPPNKPTYYPGWWFEHDVIRRTDTNVTSPSWPTHYPAVDDYVIVNQGQVKHIASKAYAEFNLRLPGGAGTNLTALINSFTTNNNYDVANIGQLKAVAEPFYARLIEVGYAATNPWTSGTDDYAAANVGQLKNLFGFDLTALAGELPEWWQLYYFGEIGINPGADADGDGDTNFEEYEDGGNPDDYYNQEGSDVLPEITVISGNNQQGLVDRFMNAPMVVEVRNELGQLLVNAPVVFSISSGAGRFANANAGAPALANPRTVWTGADGLAQTYLFPEVVGTATVTATAGTGITADQVSFSATVSTVPLGGLLVWFKADDGVTVDGSNNVSQWLDRSGSGNHAAQSTTGLKPVLDDDALNDLPVIQFDGSDDFMAFTEQTTVRTVVLVVKHDTGTQTNGTLLGHASVGTMMGGTGTTLLDSSTATLFTGGSAYAYLNSTAKTPSSLTKPTAFSILTFTTSGNASLDSIARDRGTAGRYWDGAYAEILAHNRVLSPAERYDVEAYLSEKYAISTDRDGDEMSDGQETEYGLNPDVNDAFEDLDGDGYPNIYEIKHSSDPSSETSTPTADFVVDPSGTYTTIQAGVNAAEAGGQPEYRIVQVKAGTYSGTGNCKIKIGNRKTLLISEEGTGATTISIGFHRDAYETVPHADRGRGFWILGTCVIEGFTIRDADIAYVDGGGIFVNSGDPVISRCIIRNNGLIWSWTDFGAIGWGKGAGIYINNGNTKVINCTFFGNIAGIGSSASHTHHKPNLRGGALYLNTGSVQVINCTIFDNYAFNSGCGLYNHAGTMTVANSIMWDNQINTSSMPGYNIGTQNTDPLTWQIHSSGGSTLVSYTDVEGGYANGVEAILNVDPLLNSTGVPGANSPVFDAGTPMPQSVRDILGTPRPQRYGYDLGAYESLDTDGDGLLDSWEIEHFSGLGIEPGGDEDGDGDTNLDEFEEETDPNDFFNGASATITVISGNSQTVRPGAFSASPLVVEVRDGSNAVVENAPVTFTITAGTGQFAALNSGAPQLVSTLTVRTAANGRAQVYFYGPIETGSMQATASTGTATPVNFSVTVSTTSLDSDSDGLTDAQEYALGTNAFWPDTDGDGVNDSADYYPFDPALSAAPTGSPSDTTPPDFTVEDPANAVLL